MTIQDLFISAVWRLKTCSFPHYGPMSLPHFHIMAPKDFLNNTLCHHNICSFLIIATLVLHISTLWTHNTCTFPHYGTTRLINFHIIATQDTFPHYNPTRLEHFYIMTSHDMNISTLWPHKSSFYPHNGPTRPAHCHIMAPQNLHLSHYGPTRLTHFHIMATQDFHISTLWSH